MKLRDRKTRPWDVQTTEIFEAAFYRRLASHEIDLAMDILDSFEKQALVNPRAAGEQHPSLPFLWLFETPSAVVRLPRILIVYTIDDQRGAIDLWNFYRPG